jgi:hypothetical protein
LFFVARKERSVIREQHPSVNAAPDYASLHPGYLLFFLGWDGANGLRETHRWETQKDGGLRRVAANPPYRPSLIVMKAGATAGVI